MIELGLLIIFIAGCCVVYLTQKHQNWLEKSLTKTPWRYLGYMALGVSLWGFVTLYTANMAVFMWLFLLMLIFGTLPFLTLLKPKVKQK